MPEKLQRQVLVEDRIMTKDEYYPVLGFPALTGELAQWPSSMRLTHSPRHSGDKSALTTGQDKISSGP